MRQQTDDLIASTEKSLNGINAKAERPGSRRRPRRFAEFLKQAREATDSGDVDGAHTLAVKAKVLLDELHPIAAVSIPFP